MPVSVPANDICAFDLGGVGKGGISKTVNLVPPADILADIAEVDSYIPMDRTATGFSLIHTLEHIPTVKYVTFLKDLYRKLKPGGTVRVIQSDAGHAIEQWQNGKLTFRSMRTILFTPEDRLRINAFHMHYNMWTADELARDLGAVGFQTTTFDAGSWPFDMIDNLCPGDLERDQGVPIRNLGVLATKPLDRVPNHLHFVFGLRPDFGGKPFSLIHYLSVKSAVILNRPHRAIMWYAYQPQGKWWEAACELAEPLQIGDHSQYQNVPRDHHAHRADLARLTILKEHGGIYLDLDTICVKPFGDLLQQGCTMGWEDRSRTQLCNAIILAEQNSPFIDKLIEAQSDFQPGMWGEVSITAAGTLARRFPNLINTVDRETFYWPSWDQTGLDLFRSESPQHFPESICFHLWEQIFWDPLLNDLTPQTIREGKSHLCRILQPWV